jgi:hypothetical protein
MITKIIRPYISQSGDKTVYKQNCKTSPGEEAPQHRRQPSLLKMSMVLQTAVAAGASGLGTDLEITIGTNSKIVSGCSTEHAHIVSIQKHIN